MNKLWTDAEIETLKNYYGKIKTKDIVLWIPNRSPTAIALKANSIGLKGQPSITRRIFELDLNYFHTPTPKSSYWAGFIAADGNIKKGKNLIRIKLSKKDELHLSQFKIDSKFSGEIKKAVKNQSSYAPHKEAISLEVNSKQWVIDLKNNYNITPAKSLTLKHPKCLDYENTIAFICGVIDGDGCIYETSGWKNSKIKCCRVFGTKNLMSWIKKTIDSISPSPVKKPSEVRLQNNKLHHYTFSGVRLKEFKKQIDKLNLPYLTRKWSKV